MSKPGAVVLPKRIHLLEGLESDFKNTIFKMTSDTLGKGQKKSSVATILNAENISDASQTSRLSSACNIEKMILLLRHQTPEPSGTRRELFHLA